MHYAVVTGIALDEKFYVRFSIFDGDDRSWRSEINDIPRRLVLPLFTFFTNIPNNSLTAGLFQFHRELQGPFWSRGFSVHRGCFRYFQDLNWRARAERYTELDSSINAG